MNEKIPQSIQIEHEEIHAEIARAMSAGGATAEAARAVTEVLQPHMIREEDLIAPALGLLRPLAAGRLAPEMAAMLPKLATLKDELPRMLAEHVRIVRALRTLMRAATEEKQQGFARLAQKLIAHAQFEEEVLYPAAIVAGDLLKAKFG